MKTVVLIKRVPDTASTFAIAPDGKTADTAKLKFVMSPYDEHAVEEAIQIRDAQGGEVVVMTAGAAEAKEILRTALAMGADRGVHIQVEGDTLTSSRAAAKVLAAAIKTEQPDLVLTGKQAVDDDAAQVAERVAVLLDCPQASLVTRVEIGDGSLTADREVEGGKYTVQMTLPAVLSIEKGINTPRYPTLPNIMKAKKKEIRDLSVSDLGLSDSELEPGLAIESLALPRQERLGKILEGDLGVQVNELIRALREDEKVL